MNRLVFIALFSLIFLVHCDDTDTQISEENLAKGKVHGTEWEFAHGSAYGRIQTGDYEITLMGKEENVGNDACATLFPNKEYVRFTAPAALGNYPVSSDANGVKFNGANSSTNFFTATSGFVQITGITSFNIQGLIQANFDDDNTIEGFFLVPICN